MPEVIKNYVAPIMTIPRQQVLLGKINELGKSLARTRKKEKKDQLRLEIDKLQIEVDAIYAAKK